MKASLGGSRAATTERVQTATDGGPTLDDAETSSARTLQCKEALLSSSDTDDGDLPYSKLVIDLDASLGGTDPTTLVGSKPTATCVVASEASSPMSAVSSTSSSRSEGTKCRVQQNSDGPKTAHRVSKPHSAELANGAQKGLKMKIRCSQSGGGGQPPRHEVSHFHPVVGSPPPAAGGTASEAVGRSTTAGHGAKAGGRGSGSHRRDRQLAKDRTKDRTTTSEKPTDHAATLNSQAAVVVVSRDVALEAAESVERETCSSSAMLTAAVAHDPYEFNASSEDSISCPAKKMKFEQVRRRSIKWVTAGTGNDCSNRQCLDSLL